MDELFAFVNGELLPVSGASLLINDLSIQRGYGIFDFFKTLGGRPVFLDTHLDRFYHSAGRMRLDVGRSREQLKDMIAALQSRNGIPDSGIRLTLTGGYSADGFAPATWRDLRPEPFGPLPDVRYRGMYVDGDRVVLRWLVGETEVLESPWFEQGVFTRSFVIGPSAAPLHILASAHSDDHVDAVIDAHADHEREGEHIE